MAEPHIRPRDAATLIIVRDGREVLLGSRSSQHVFMPEVYVFPGGRVDAGDARVPAPVNLQPAVEARLLRSTTAARARALAMTAVRETWEETGLVIGYPVERPARSRSRHWQPFFDLGYVPALDRLQYVARAITPPGSPRRFDARFFLVDASHAAGDLRSNGELEDLHWVPLEQARRLPLSEITELMLEQLGSQLTRPETHPDKIPFYREVGGREVVDFE